MTARPGAPERGHTFPVRGCASRLCRDPTAASQSDRPTHHGARPIRPFAQRGRLVAHAGFHRSPAVLPGGVAMCHVVARPYRAPAAAVLFMINAVQKGGLIKRPHARPCRRSDLLEVETGLVTRR